MDTVNPHEKTPSYKEEFSHSVDLFERSFHAYQDSKMDNQKLVFKDVMDKATKVMDETAPKCLSSSEKKELESLKKHYEDFLSHPESQISSSLQKDINKLKNV